MFRNISLLITIAALFSLNEAVKLDLEEDEYINSASLLEQLFANNHEDIQQYFDLSDYRPNTTYVEIDDEEHVDPVVYRNETFGVVSFML